MSEAREVEAQGFAIFPDVFSHELLDQAMVEIARSAPVHSRAGVRHALYLQPVSKLAQCPQLMRIAADHLGPAAFPYRATLFEKTASMNWLIVWHQDTAMPLCERQVVQGWGPWSVKDGIPYAHAPAPVLTPVPALRIHFDDSNHENGPLRVLPGTHNYGVLSDDEFGEFSTRVAPVECLAPKGGVVAMRPLLIHSSSKLRSDMPRRVLHIEYAASESIASPLQLTRA